MVEDLKIPKKPSAAKMKQYTYTYRENHPERYRNYQRNYKREYYLKNADKKQEKAEYLWLRYYYQSDPILCIRKLYS
tara:strand:+ start:103 stop:333 length:231 start_codon:yes stop_codon:yes gene_type:complete